MKKINISIFVGIFMFLFVASNASAAFVRYTVLITEVITQTNGAVQLKYVNGTDETACVDWCRATIHQDDPGAKNSTANVLTAVSLGKEVRVYLENPPTTTNQFVGSISVLY